MPSQTCISCGYSQQDDFKFCPACGYDHSSSLDCPECGYPNELNSKFCQECGRQLIPKTAKKHFGAASPSVSTPPVIIVPVPDKGITIEFPYSSAQSFDFAVIEAKKHQSFTQFGEEKKAIYRITVQQDELGGLVELLEHLKGWRKKVVYIDGEKTPWEAAFAFEWCYRKKLASFRPELYCFGYDNEWESNIWGCIQAHLPCDENAQWFRWGKWLNRNGDWQFEKDRIMHELQKALYSVRLCPALRTNFIERIVSALPDVVNPNKDSNWRFIESYGSNGEDGITMTRTKYGYEEQVVLVGVYPASKTFLTELRDRVKRQTLS